MQKIPSVGPHSTEKAEQNYLYLLATPKVFYQVKPRNVLWWIIDNTNDGAHPLMMSMMFTPPVYLDSHSLDLSSLAEDDVPNDQEIIDVS